MLMVRGQTGEVNQKVDGGQDTNPNGKCIIVLLILLTISTQLIKYLLATLTGTVDGGWMGGVDGGMASRGSGKFEVCGGS